MSAFFGPVSNFDILYAAVAAFAITFLIVRMSNAAKNGRNQMPTGPRDPQSPSPNSGGMPPQLSGKEGEAFIAQCRELFPQKTVVFQNATFESGDRIRVVTSQQRMIEGELIGQNDQRVICIRTRQNVIAQKLDRVVGIQKVPNEPE